MSPRQEDLLLNASWYKDKTLILRLLVDCLVDPGATIHDVNELVIGDKETILVSLRITGYGSLLTFPIECPQCSAENEINIQLNRLDMQELGGDLGFYQLAQEGRNALVFRLPASKKTVTFKLLTHLAISDEDEAEEENGVVNKATKFLFDSVLSVDGVEDRKAVLSFCRRMPVSDSSTFRRYVDAIKPRIDLTHNFVCVSCDYRELIVVPCNNAIFQIRPKDREVVFLEPFFVLTYYAGMTWETYLDYPVEYKRWLIKRINTEIKTASESQNGAPTKASHHNGPETSAMLNKFRHFGNNGKTTRPT